VDLVSHGLVIPEGCCANVASESPRSYAPPQKWCICRRRWCKCLLRGGTRGEDPGVARMLHRPGSLGMHHLHGQFPRTSCTAQTVHKGGHAQCPPVEHGPRNSCDLAKYGERVSPRHRRDETRLPAPGEDPVGNTCRRARNAAHLRTSVTMLSSALLLARKGTALSCASLKRLVTCLGPKCEPRFALRPDWYCQVRGAGDEQGRWSRVHLRQIGHRFAADDEHADEMAGPGGCHPPPAPLVSCPGLAGWENQP